MEWLHRMAGRLGEIGPYLAIELIAPGGSVLALLLWLYRHRAAARGSDATAAAGAERPMLRT
jgi:hypothetical protein